MRLEASVVTLVEFVVLVVSELLRRCRRTELWVAHVRDKYVVSMDMCRSSSRRSTIYSALWAHRIALEQPPIG